MLYRFDGFELDLRRYELRRDGVPCHVEKLVFDLLAFLVRNPGRVLGREEVVDQVWQGRAVSAATISSCVKAARRALGDSGDSPTYIRTIRGRGFEFAARVAVVNGQAAEAVLPDVTPPPGTPTGDTSSLPILAVLPFTNLSVA